MYHIVNISQTSEECFSSSNLIEIYCNEVWWHNSNMTKRCQSEQKNHPQKNSVHWTCTLDFVVIKSLVCKRVFHLSFEAGSTMRIVLEKKKTCMPLLTL